MTITPIPPIPTPPSRGMSPAAFVPIADAFLAAFPAMRDGMNATALSMDALGVQMTAQVAITAGDVTLTGADLMATAAYRAQAQAYVGDAAAQAAIAVAAAASAVNAPGTNGTSITNLTIGTIGDTVTFTTQTGKLWSVGQHILMASTASPVNQQGGTMLSYNSGTGVMQIKLDEVAGVGTFAAWTVSLAPASGSARIASLERGIRANLCFNGGLENGLAGLTVGGSMALGAGDFGWNIYGSANGSYDVRWPPFFAQAGVTYNITGDSGLSATSGSVYFDIQFYDAAGTLLLDGPQNPISGNHDFSENGVNRTTHAVSSVAPASTAYGVPRFVADTIVGATVVACRQIKVERGSLPATAFSDEATLPYFGPGLVHLVGDGSDGSATITGALTLTRDMFYQNLTIGAGAAINVKGFRIFVAGLLNISSAPAGAIYSDGGAGGNGGNGVSSVGGGSGTAGTPGAPGTAGTIGVGAAPNVIGNNGGASGASGNGGNGVNHPDGFADAVLTAGASIAAKTVTPFLSHLLRTQLTQSETVSTLVLGGAGGPPGTPGASEIDEASGNTGGGGGEGGGGAGGGIVAIYANAILRGPGTAVGCIRAKGGLGGNGGNHYAATLSGGGGGGAGGGGGWVFIYANALLGTAAVNAIDVTGGNGGNGGAGLNTLQKGGAGGGSGAGGRITGCFPHQTGMYTQLSSAAAKAIVAATAAPGAVGATANVAQFSL